MDDGRTTRPTHNSHDGPAVIERRRYETAVFEFNLFGTHIVLTRQRLLVGAAVLFVLFVWRVWWRRER